MDIPSFKTGLGFRLSVSKSGKVFGYVALGGREWGTAACVRNSDCDDGNVCTLGICTVQCERVWWARVWWPRIWWPRVWWPRIWWLRIW